MHVEWKKAYFFNATFNGDLKNGPTFIDSTIFDKFIGKNIKGLDY